MKLNQLLPWPRCLHRGFLFLVSFYNDPEREVAKTQTKTQSRKLAEYKKEQGRRVLDPRALDLDPHEIKIDHPKRGVLPRRNLSHHLQNTCSSKRFDEERFLRYCFLLFLIPSKMADQTKANAHLEYHHQLYFLSSLLSCLMVSSTSFVSKDLLPFLCSFVMSLYLPSTTNACGYFFCKSDNLATISSLDSWSML